jgi:hypothetical protein
MMVVLAQFSAAYGSFVGPRWLITPTSVRLPSLCHCEAAPTRVAVAGAVGPIAHDELAPSACTAWISNRYLSLDARLLPRRGDVAVPSQDEPGTLLLCRVVVAARRELHGVDLAHRCPASQQ